MTTNDPPYCKCCGKKLDRIDHCAIEHTMLREDTYGPVGIMDGGVNGEEYGLASEIDLCCGYCGATIHMEAKAFFYKRWANVKDFMAANGLRDASDDV
jgi:hypothetical protein